MPRGGKREGAGRKSGSTKNDARSAWIAFRCTENEKQQIKELAAAQGMSMSEFILSRCFNS